MRARGFSLHSSAGFTLVELIVALGLFAMVAVISLDALLAVSYAQKEAIAGQNNFDNIRFSLEAMTKEIKAGEDFDCNQGTAGLNNCEYPSGGRSTLAFSNDQGVQVTYLLTSGQLVRRTTTGPCSTAPSFCPITAKSVQISRLLFFLSGAPLADSEQPRITVVMEGQTPGFKAGLTERFNLQTTVAARPLDK